MKYGIAFLVAFTLWTHIVPQFAEWRYYARTFNGDYCSYYIPSKNPKAAGRTAGGTESYKADFLWSRLMWDFYYDCIPSDVPPLSTLEKQKQ